MEDPMLLGIAQPSSSFSVLCLCVSSRYETDYSLSRSSLPVVVQCFYRFIKNSKMMIKEKDVIWAIKGSRWMPNRFAGTSNLGKS